MRRPGWGRCCAAVHEWPIGIAGAIARLQRVLWPNEPFTTCGIITGRRVEDGRTRAEVTVFCEKADGTKIIVASASALEG